ncbi:MAG: hypothetical protein M0Z67_17815 [Nitrospiraceae bacterium]|nr:hypothetical protein [Nitrospiraceae bacterium]
MDGARLDVSSIGPVGITLAGGRDVINTLDGAYSRNGNYFVGVDVHLQDVKNTELGISYARKYDESDLAREELGMNFRYNYKIVSPYVELNYDVTSEVFDEATLGVEVYPMDKLLLKGEFYHSYPTFDATSIYSVFAVDKYREYMVSAEYRISSPVSVFASYVKQTYEEDSNADVFRVGARLVPVEKLAVNASVDYRNGYGGNLWGFEVTGDYRINEKIAVAAGVQYERALRHLPHAGDRPADKDHEPQPGYRHKCRQRGLHQLPRHRGRYGGTSGRVPDGTVNGIPGCADPGIDRSQEQVQYLVQCCGISVLL